jgi:hypothetical protein
MATIRTENAEQLNSAHYSKYREIFYDEYTEEPNKEAWDTLQFCLESGYTDLQVATYLGVSRVSIGNWKRSYPEFLEFCRKYKAVADDAVERALFERAVGVDIVKSVVKIKDGQVDIVDIVEHIPGDVKAQLNWLYNRRPEKWKQIVHNSNENINKQIDSFDTSKLTDAELEAYAALLKKMEGGN